MLNYQKTIKILSLSIASALFVSACATSDGTEDIDDSYMKSPKGPQLQLPPGTSEIKATDSYRVPEGTVITQRDAKGKKLSLEPPQLLLIAGDGVWVDTERAEPTVWVRATESELIAYIERFMKSQSLAYQEPSNDTITTEWVVADGESKLSERLGPYHVDNQRHKFSLNIVDKKPNEVALQAKHLAYQHEVDGQWVDVNTSERVAKQFLNYFVGYYDSERTREARERILQEAKVDMELGYNDQGSLALITEREVLAVWEQLPRVLTALNLEITDHDRSEQTYYFNVREPDDGFWSWFGDDENEAKVDLEPGSYQVKLVELSAGGTGMNFYGAEGNLLESNVITRIYPEFSAEFKRGKGDN